jgi:hypothetical protein
LIEPGLDDGEVEILDVDDVLRRRVELGLDELLEKTILFNFFSASPTMGQKKYSGWKPTHLTSVFSLQTSVFIASWYYANGF